jgi:oligopeptide/dipeptide ABC transporter ATP-binding protein
MKELLLEVKGLKKYFPIISGFFRHQVGSVKAIDDVDFKIHSGEVLGLVGESGSGKSTIGRTLLRLVEPTGGKAIFEGVDLLALDPKAMRLIRTQLQMVFQDPYASLNPRKTVFDSIGESLSYYRIATTVQQQRDMVAEVLKKIGLPSSSMSRYPHEFSGGQQQRICIGRAIALNPKLIILDEAVSALDVSVQAQILNLLSELKQNLGLSYLFISHDLSIVRHISDRVVVLYLGKVMETASTEELFNNPKHPYTQALLSAIPKRDPKEKKQRIVLKGEIPSASNPPSGCPFRTRCPYAQPICAETPPIKVVKDCVTGIDDHIYHCILD